MSRLVVRYRPAPEHAEENQRLVEAVFAQLAAERPEGIRYASLRLADGTFVHLTEIDGEASVLTSLESFQAFQRGVRDRCLPEHRPDAQAATVVGAYRFFDEG